MEPEEIKKYYSKVAKEYNKIVLGKAKYTAYKKIGSWVVKELKKKDAKILDLGCGTGLSSLEFFKRGYKVTGIDISPEIIKEARKLPFSKLICQNLENPLKVQNKSYDAVVLTGVTEFIKNPLKLFKEVNEKLKDNGIFAVTIPKKLSKSSKLKIKNYYKKEIEPIFIKVGFKITGCKEFFGYYKRGDPELGAHYYGYLLRKI